MPGGLDSLFLGVPEGVDVMKALKIGPPAQFSLYNARSIPYHEVAIWVLNIFAWRCFRLVEGRPARVIWDPHGRTVQGG